MSNHFYDKMNKRETFEFKITYTLLGTLNETKKKKFFLSKIARKNFHLKCMYKKSFGCMINIPSTYPIIGGKKKNDGICGNFIIFMSKNEMPLSLICCNRVALHREKPF